MNDQNSAANAAAAQMKSKMSLLMSCKKYALRSVILLSLAAAIAVISILLRLQSQRQGSITRERVQIFMFHTRLRLRSIRQQVITHELPASVLIRRVTLDFYI